MTAVAIGACCAVGLAPLAHAVPWTWEKRLGYVTDLGFGRRKCPPSLEAERLMAAIETRLYPIEKGDQAFSIDIERVKDPTVNAYAGLGGHIVVTSALLEQAGSAEELAGVLAHEIAHIERRHILEGTLAHLLTIAGLTAVFGGDSSPAAWTNYFLKMTFTRDQEAEADRDGLVRLQKAQINNSGFKAFFERLEQEQDATQFLADHPSNQDRIEMVAAFNNPSVKPLMTEPEWQTLKHACNSH